MSVPVNSNLTPRTTGYPLIDDKDVAGSLHVVGDITDRDLIPVYVLKIGMIVYTANNSTYWKLSQISPSVIWDVFSSEGDITPDTHKVLRQLIHFIDEGPAEGFASGAHKQVIGGLFPTSIIWWESALMTKKIVEKIITRTGGGATNLSPTPIVWKIYDVDGTTVLATVSDSITYSGVFEISRTRVIT